MIIEERFKLLEALELLRGAHEADNGKCALEAVAWLAGENHSDHPVCVSPVLGDFCRNWNDNLDDVNRQRLKPYLARLIGTAGDAKADERRAWMAMDWLTRECGPAFMDLTPVPQEHANALRAMPEITNQASLKATKKIRAAARDAVWAAAWDAAKAAAWDAAKDATRDAAKAAAWDAVWAAAGDAARAAAWDAARDAARAAAGAAAGAAAWAAARDAAWDAAKAAAGAAAWDAAWDAAGAAAWDAAKDATRDAATRTLAPVVARLQDSAFCLLDRMIEAKA